MKSIAVFRSDAFDHSWPEDGSDPNAVPPGRDLAEYLKAELAKVNIVVRGPFKDADGWVVYGDIENVPFSLFIHCVPIGTPPADYWTIQSQIRRGFLKSLFGSRKPSEELQPLVKILISLLSHDT